ncbi:MAG: electron transport complex subunit RsxE [Limnochordia bacterium]|jgi:electron transport complex protein RnfE|nr:electron transport complex subunit E [Bacillota bacterium]NLL08044.1 electron transport complex subunit E [Bacillota bacterium]HBG09832.1 electron transport complex subunit RsxE [Bacillota bacterium]
MARLWKNFANGLWNENPTFRIMIGLCPVLAVTTSAKNGVGMGLATTFVLICSSALISLLRKVIPDKVRIPAYIVVIATFVTIVDLFMNAYLPDLHQVLGLFIPLIVVNCIVLGRAEAFASKNSLISSILDGLGMGLGFTWALTVLGAVRELLGSGSLFGYQLAADGATTIGIMSLPPGAFITLGILMAFMNMIAARQKKRATKEVRP